MSEQIRNEATEAETEEIITRERYRLLVELEGLLEVPMIVLGFAWLGLLVIELTAGLSRGMQIAVTAIWVAFIFDFMIKLAIAPRKRRFLARNWLTIVALVVPALRIARIGSAVRFLRFGRTTQSLRVVRVLASTNRGLRSLRRTMTRRSFGYVMLATLMVAGIGSVALRALEGGSAGTFAQLGDALWWTMMILITLPTGTWPETAEGRILGFFLALYGFAMFGYVTAMLASWFVGRDDEEDLREEEILRAVHALESQIGEMRQELKRIQGRA
ncbi:MAG: potassium channel protein [Thermoanaerobaculia bacterium]|nr:potassium channel protein [Thermoanaerobaculia bacterium]